MSSSVSNLQLLNNTEYRLKFKTGSDINNALIQPTTTHSLSFLMVQINMALYLI